MASQILLLGPKGFGSLRAGRGASIYFIRISMQQDRLHESYLLHDKLGKSLRNPEEKHGAHYNGRQFANMPTGICNFRFDTLYKMCAMLIPITIYLIHL